MAEKHRPRVSGVALSPRDRVGTVNKNVFEKKANKALYMGEHHCTVR